MKRTLIASAVGLTMVVTTTPAEAAPVPKRITTQVKQLKNELDELRARYENRAAYYAERADTDQDTTPYRKLYERFTLLAARAASLRAELEGVRTAGDLSAIRRKKVKLHQSATASLRTFMESTRTGS